MKELVDGKIALITGSTRGIGWSTAQLLAEHGATVILNGRSDSALLDARVSELNERFPGKAMGLQFDVADLDKGSEAYKEIFKAYKRLDILVNNAGILRDGLLGMISQETIQQTFSINTFSALWHTQQASRLMSRNQSGSIINMSSIAGVRGVVGHSVYAASKAALIGLTLASAKELAPHSIRVNAIAPGIIDTEMSRNIPEDKIRERANSIAMKRMGKPEEVANVVLFLASDLASYVTGQVLGVDGGLLM